MQGLHLSKLVVCLVLVGCVGVLFTGCKNDDEPTSPDGTTPGGGLTSSIPTSILIFAVAEVSAKITGGTPPYSVQSNTNPQVATASISNDTVTIMAVNPGTTIIVIEDSSSSPGDAATSNTVTFTVEVWGGSGSMSFNSDQGNFSVSGVLPNLPPGQGAGGVRVVPGDREQLLLFGAALNSATDWSITILCFFSQQSATLDTGTYLFLFPAVFSWFPHLNPNDSTTSENVFLLSDGSANLSSLSESHAQGTFSGSGYNIQTGDLISVSNGQFDISYARGELSPSANDVIEVIVRKIARKQLGVFPASSKK